MGSEKYKATGVSMLVLHDGKWRLFASAETVSDCMLLADELNANAAELATLRAKLAEVEGEREKQDRSIEQLCGERDAAEDALSHAYFLITGRSPEWSNLFGHAEAIEEISDAQRLLRGAVTAAKSSLSAYREAVKVMAEELAANYACGEAFSEGKLTRLVAAEEATDANPICKEALIAAKGDKSE